ncbi:MAG: carboxylating nicotinate-nucleotide diphosphorylase [Bacteroidetes bacterium]|nr:carboxylating nicotinate-nucleotide diphosphorylase [Bacteroidota bacterium]MBP6314939.1 carboxylating nicotinate-nucleotide diphosphorylase [Chitinophagaceae bacterium]
MDIKAFITSALNEDIGTGDHSTLACIETSEVGKAVLKIKEAGILAGIEVATEIFLMLEPDCQIQVFIEDGSRVSYGEIAFEVRAKVHTILSAERLVLNIMQRMSGIATLTRRYVERIKEYPAHILDTRKTTPNFRWFEKQAVVIGGGQNHRMGLYDMIMLKDNHIDYCGSIENAIDKTNRYLAENQLDLKIEIEARSLEDVRRILAHGGVHRIMLDNFTPEALAEAVQLIDTKYETEASGGINLDTIESYAKSQVDYISVGAIIHHAVSMDLSLKAVK